MTEYEMLDLLQGWFEMMMTQSALYFTLVSAYLVVAFLAGKQLTRPQMLIISVLYVVWTFGLIFSLTQYVANSARLEAELDTLQSSAISGDSTYLFVATAVFMALQAAGVVASLYFMRSIRTSKIA